MFRKMLTGLFKNGASGLKLYVIQEGHTLLYLRYKGCIV